MRPEGAAVMTDKPSVSLFRILPLYIIIFVAFFGYSLMITILTPMIMEDSGGIMGSLPFEAERPIVLGVLLALYPLGQFFGSPVLGAMSDKFGRRPVLLVSLGVIAACYGLFAFSIEIRNLPLLMAVSLVAGLADSDIATAQSAIADLSTEETRGRLFGYIYLSASSAFIAGPLIGGRLADPSLVRWFSYSTPYEAVFILLIGAFVFSFLVFRETHPPRRRRHISYSDAFTHIFSIFTAGRIRFFYLVNFLIYFSIFGFFRAYPLYLVDVFGMGVERVSLFVAWVAVPIALANLGLTGFVSGYFSTRTVTLYSTAVCGLFMFAVILPESEGALWVTLFLPGLALAVALPACSSMLLLSAGTSEEGRVLGNNQSLQVGAEALSGFGAGLLAAVFFKLPLIVFSAVAILAALLLAAEGRGRERKE